MSKTSKTAGQGGGAETGTGTQDLEKRVDELEIKIAFLEKELEEYKEASRGFYRKLTEAEGEIDKLRKEIPPRDLATPEVTWDSENRDVRP